jgi:hypothetical protein
MRSCVEWKLASFAEAVEVDRSFAGAATRWGTPPPEMSEAGGFASSSKLVKNRALRRRDAKVPAAKRNSATFRCNLWPGSGLRLI